MGNKLAFKWGYFYNDIEGDKIIFIYVNNDNSEFNTTLDSYFEGERKNEYMGDFYLFR